MDISSEKEVMLSDEEIVELYFERNEAAIEKTEIKYGKMLFRIAYNILHSKEDSEECKNDTYLGVWNAIPPTRPNVFPAFITGIMRNVAIKKYRENTSEKHIPSELTLSIDELFDAAAMGDSPDEICDARELGGIISDYIRTLDKRQRYIFIGRFYMAEKIEYLARTLGVGVATVHRDIERMKKGLSDHLKERGLYV